MTETLTQEQRDRRWKQAHTAIQNALAASWTEWRRTGRRPDFTKAADHAMDGLADLAAEILSDGTMMKALTVKDGEVCLELDPANDMLKVWVAAMRGILHGHGAENYVEHEMHAPAVSMDLRDSDTPHDSYTVTVQRRERPTPHEFRLRAEARVAAVLSECDALEAEVYGQHDEDDDGIREAVRRIRAVTQETARA